MSTYGMDTYEVDDPQIKSLLYVIGRRLKDGMPPGWGFSLFLFSFGRGGAMFYLSSAQREDMVESLKEFLRREGETSLAPRKQEGTI